VTISQMDTCIEQGTADPASAFTYITGDTLGAAWDDLSESEKQFAVDRANADASTDAQLIARAKSLGVSLAQLRHQKTQ